jgi:hypothetical protein
LDNKLVDSYEIKDLKTISPRLRISGVSSDLGKEHIISFLVKQNSSVFSNPSQLKILKYFPTKKKPDVFQFILQVDVNTYIKALNSKHCLIGLDNCYIFDAIDVIRCYRCNGYHHSHTFCKRNLSCPRCSESHEVKECKSTVLRCWDTNECQYYLNLIANIKKDLFGDITLPSYQLNSDSLLYQEAVNIESLSLFVDSNITLTGGDRLISPLDLGSSVASASNSVRKPEQISFLVQYLNAGGMNTKISDFFESTGGSQSDVIAVSET